MKGQRDILNIDAHSEQLQTQRQAIQKIENELPAKSTDQFKVVVYEDFYSHYSENPQNAGNKVNTLALTIKWKGEDKKAKKVFLDFICSDQSNSADSFFVIQVWQILLQVNKELRDLENTLSPEEREIKEKDIARRIQTGELIAVLKGVTHIVRTGDSGPHFHSRITYNWESSVWEEYGINWETHTLCKRHASNECDAHGGSVQRAWHAVGVKGSPPGVRQHNQHVWCAICRRSSVRIAPTKSNDRSITS